MVVLAFLWPSAGSILRYLTDVANAEASVDPFVRLIELLAANTQAAGIDVLAYSAGAQIVSPGLARLGTPRPGESREQLRQRLRLGQIYFAAPDVDTRQFVDDLARYVNVVDRVSMAANLNDSALRFAGLVHRASRAGRPNPTELDVAQTGFLLEASRELGFDLIKVDPNTIPKLPQNSHAFWYEDPWVSSDLLGLLLLNAAPQQRGLVPAHAANGTLLLDVSAGLHRARAAPVRAWRAGARRAGCGSGAALGVCAADQSCRRRRQDGPGRCRCPARARTPVRRGPGYR